MIPWQLGVQQNAAMYSNAHAWMQTFDYCCMCLKGSQRSCAEPSEARRDCVGQRYCVGFSDDASCGVNSTLKLCIVVSAGI